jgi:hypothetical protein
MEIERLPPFSSLSSVVRINLGAKIMTEITGESPQAVAYRLLELIALNEGKKLTGQTATADRKWIL